MHVSQHNNGHLAVQHSTRQHNNSQRSTKIQYHKWQGQYSWIAGWIEATQQGGQDYTAQPKAHSNINITDHHCGWHNTATLVLTEQYKRHSLAMSRVNNTNVKATTDSMLNDSMAQPSIWHTQPHISTTHCYSTIMHILQHNSVQGSTKTHMAAQQGICKSSTMYTSKHNIVHVKSKQHTWQSMTTHMANLNNAHVEVQQTDSAA